MLQYRNDTTIDELSFVHIFNRKFEAKKSLKSHAQLSSISISNAISNVHSTTNIYTNISFANEFPFGKSLLVNYSDNKRGVCMTEKNPAWTTQEKAKGKLRK